MLETIRLIEWIRTKKSLLNIFVGKEVSQVLLAYLVIDFSVCTSYLIASDIFFSASCMLVTVLYYLYYHI